MKGTGIAQTDVDAFDDALISCGIGNYNLIRLSSVIPPNSEVVEVDIVPNDFGEWGDRLYVVYAYGSTAKKNQETWAGIGWVIVKENGGGLFIEHTANSKKECERLIKQSLNKMCEERGVSLNDFGYEQSLVGSKCTDNGKTTSALVAAVYEAEGWGNR